MPHQRRNDLFSRYLLATAIASRIRPSLAALADETWAPGPSGTIRVSSSAYPRATTLRVVDPSPYADERTEYLSQVCPENIASLLSLVDSVVKEQFGTQAWIATADALPATSASVLAWHRDEDHKVLRYLASRQADGDAQGWHTLDGQPVPPDQVLAWRVLPPPFPAERAAQTGPVSPAASPACPPAP